MRRHSLPAFAGEPISPETRRIMTEPLCWEDDGAFIAWAQAIAYYASGARSSAAPPVRALARKHLQRLLDAAEKGLDVAAANEAAPARMRTTVRRTQRAGGAQ